MIYSIIYYKNDVNINNKTLSLVIHMVYYKVATLQKKYITRVTGFLYIFFCNNCYLHSPRSNIFCSNKPSYSQFKVLTSALYFHHLHLRLFTLHFPAIFSFLQSLKITVFENQISGHLKQVLLASLLLKSICFLRSDATYLPL